MKELYYVAAKLFIRKGEQLLIIKDIFGDWDFPGGRIRKDEFKTPLEGVIKRKVREELGRAVCYSLGRPIVFMRHERREASVKGKPRVRIFAIGYEARYRGGAIQLGSIHKEYKWVSVVGFRPEKYFKGGWLEGAKEYLKLARKKSKN